MMLKSTQKWRKPNKEHEGAEEIQEENEEQQKEMIPFQPPVLPVTSVKQWRGTDCKA